MTVSSREDSDAAFDLASLFRDQDFRAFMANNGYVSGTTVVVAYDYEPVTEVFSRILSETTPPVVVAVRRPAEEPYGFVFMTIGQVEYDKAAEVADSDSGDRIGRTASIGMLYDTMREQQRPKRQWTVPNDWQPATFSVELARSAR